MMNRSYLGLVLKLSFSLIAFLLLGDVLMAQPGPPGGGGGPPCIAGPCIPIDGGISGLIALGLAWGGKKLYDQSRSE